MRNQKIHLSLISISTNFKPRLEELKALKSSTQRSVFMDVYKRRRKFISEIYATIAYFVNIGKCRTVKSRSILSYGIDYVTDYPDTIRSCSRVIVGSRMINVCKDNTTILYRSNR